MDTPQLSSPSLPREPRPLLREPLTWRRAAAFWVAIGLAGAVLEYAVTGSGTGAAAMLVYSAVWWLTTMLALGLADALPLVDRWAPGLLALHALAGVAVAVGWAAATYHLNAALLPDWTRYGFREMLDRWYVETFATYVGIAGVVHAIRFFRASRWSALRADRADARTSEARGHVLKMELQPHFLFNALNSISALVYRDPRAATRMIALLADVLRSSIATSRRQQVELREEIRTLSSYLGIQRIRFGDRLEVRWDVDPATLPALVPDLILQPLVENAIVHGVGERSDGGTVTIRGRRIGERVELAVLDDGVGIGDSLPEDGIGLANTRARLAQLYGSEHRFEIADAEGGGTRATISIPFRTAPSEGEVPLGAGHGAGRMGNPNHEGG